MNDTLAAIAILSRVRLHLEQSWRAQPLPPPWKTYTMRQDEHIAAINMISRAMRELNRENVIQGKLNLWPL